MRLKQVRLTIFIIALVMFAGGVGYKLGSKGISLKISNNREIRIERIIPPNKEIDFSLFWTTWDRLESSYLDKSAIRPQEMIYGAIKGMVASLGDPYTVFLKPEENKEAKEDLDGMFEGVGIQLGYRDGNLAVVSPLVGMPAEKAGVRAGDLILKIDNKETTSMAIPEAVKLIRGPKGTAVRLTLLHQGEEKPYEVSIIRDTIIVPSVELEFPREDIAHLKLTRFGDRTSEEWNKLIDQIISHQPEVKGIILDLRNNPGGYLSGSVYIASEFLPSGMIVIQENSDGKRETYSVNRVGKIINQRLVVLVNQGSASASEIVAGALQEYKRAKIVGDKTFGKGTIQETEDLPGGAGLHITTARWLLPSGKTIDKNGIIPDNQITDNPDTKEDEQLQRAIEIISY